MQVFDLKREKCLIIGEVAQAHDGSLGAAHAFIDAIADSGADAVKFQTHIAAEESTPSEPWRVKFSYQDATRFDYWKRMEFTEEQWVGLKKHADERNIFFLSSPFSVKAAKLLSGLGIPAWKIASGEVTNLLLMDYFLETDLPILISTGLCTIDELDQIVRMVKENKNQIAVMQCTTKYPCPPEQIGLNVLDFFRNRYDCPVGLSDHSGTVYPGLAAAALGIEVLEVHVTFSKDMFGPDVSSSVTTDELRELVQGLRFIEKMRNHQADKSILSDETKELRKIFGKSIFVTENLQAGTRLEKGHLTLKKPGTGIPATKLTECIGRMLKNDVDRNHMLSRYDLENG